MPAQPAARSHLHHLLAGGAILVLSGSCGPAYHPPPVTPQLVNLARAPLSEVANGYTVHQTNCAKCHAFEDPARHAPGKLTREIIPTMAAKAKLSQADARAVLAYLLAARQLAASAP